MRPEIYKAEGYKLMGAAFEVYNVHGHGLGEEIYQESLELELLDRGLGFDSKRELTCYYKGRPLRKKYIPDLFVLGSIVVELKSVSELCPEHEAQLINYIRLSKQPVGYLINFGHKGILQWKRITLSEFIPGSELSAEISVN